MTTDAATRRQPTIDTLMSPDGRETISAADMGNGRAMVTIYQAGTGFSGGEQDLQATMVDLASKRAAGWR